MPVRDVAAHFPFELLVAPVLQVLEHLQSENDLGRRSTSTSSCALRVSATKHLVHLVDKRLVFERGVDEAEDGIHQVLRLAKRRREHEFGEGKLRVSTPRHREGMAAKPQRRQGFSELFWRKTGITPHVRALRQNDASDAFPQEWRVEVDQERKLQTACA